ncbi:MAG: heavy metal translocating P-type ATPase [Saprospiraceae bacterium]
MATGHIIMKLLLEIPLLLPDIPDEKDACVKRIMAILEGKKGVEKVHVKPGNPPLLCIHYNPEILSLENVRAIAEQSGAEISERYRHRLIQIEGIRHPRHARQVSEALGKKPGILEAVATATGTLRIEYDNTKIDWAEVQQAIQDAGLTIVSPGEKVETKEKHHEHGGIFGEQTELIFALLSGGLLAAGFGLSFVGSIPAWVPLMLYIGTYFFGGYFTLIEAVQTVRRGSFEIDFLMLVAAGGAAALGEWVEGGFLLFLFSLGHSLEHLAMHKAEKSIAALAELAPDTAFVKRNGRLQEVPVEELRPGDVIVVKPHTKVAADGVVINGESAVNQASVTGESVPVDKYPYPGNTPEGVELREIPSEHRVFAGSINGAGVLEVRVLKGAKDSTLARLIQLVKEAGTQKSDTQLFTDRFERWFVPAVLVLVVLLCFAFLLIDEPFSKSFYRAMAVLVAASPCALAISTPSAVLSGIARAARQGVLVKGGAPLEDLGQISAIAFDKTGTLTEGKPKLTQVRAWKDTTREQLLEVVLAVESLSDHPLARAIAEGAAKELNGRSPGEASSLEALAGRGVRAEYLGQQVFIGNRELFEKSEGAQVPQELLQEMQTLEGQGNTTMIVRMGEQYLGLVAVMDLPRPRAAETLQKLRKTGVKRMVMLTGDNQRVALAVARKIGIDDPVGNLLPEQKVAYIEKLLREEGMVAMVGDGVNDAPALAKSSVGIAMGAAGSDVALETADIALMSDKLENLPFAIALSRKARNIIRQNLWVSLGMVALLVPLTLAGIAEIGPAVVAHEGSTLVVVVNSLRLLKFNYDP